MDSPAPRFAVVGDPIAHSLSPTLFSAFLEEAGSVASYGFIRGDARLSFRELFARLGLRGVSVTAPLKGIAAQQVDRLVGAAAKLGMVNTVVARNGLLYGYNSDVDGVRYALARLGLCNRQKGIILLGAGGAAEAVALTLAEGGFEFTILNRSRPRGELLAGKYGARFYPFSQGMELPDDAVVISCLPPDSQLPPLDWGRVGPLFDAVYSGSPLGAVAERVGLARVGALEWLYGQALGAFPLLTSFPPPRLTMREAFGAEKKRPTRCYPLSALPSPSLLCGFDWLVDARESWSSK